MSAVYKLLVLRVLLTVRHCYDELGRCRSTGKEVNTTIGRLQKRDFLIGVWTVWWANVAWQAGQSRSLAEACVLSGGQRVGSGGM